ncbi:MAG TPA: cytochrome c-type biogenesis protein CcmH [Candidatus Binataceae bacterium]|nr:cytochrome c-type biogenesis protein CcmH [Candidatus Binataceae bacterium]
MKRLLFYAAPLGVLALLFSFALGGDLAVRAAERPTLATVSQGLTCQCGCGLTVANCNHPTCSFSVPVREQIESMIGKGESGAQIIAFYRQKYGEKVLSAPTTEGFNMVAWVMPFLVVALGGAVIVYTANRWRSLPAARGTSAVQSPESGAAQFDAELKDRLAQEIRERS